MVDVKVKQWSVTYTKHIKQKRKVYQDGFLELHSSSSNNNNKNNKAMLYDDCKKLLESRFLKQDDVVCSGETLKFNSYHVDVGEPYGDHKPAAGVNLHRNEANISEKTGMPHRQKFLNNSVAFGDRNTTAEKNKIQPTLIPSQKIVREFRRSTLQKYGLSQSTLESMKTPLREWQVLYTTQLTQKAKKYHDGFLQLTFCGSQQRQAMLYDARRQLLDCRFLKKEEVIRSGESITFEAHLVDVGDLAENQEPLTDFNHQGSNRNVVHKTGILHGQEWNVLYSSQITQKAKKYHNGILRLSFSGSYHMQVSLLDENKTKLSSKHLTSSADVRTGCVLMLPKYLVEVGEPCKTAEGPEGKLQNNVNSKNDFKHSISIGDNKKSSSRLPTNKMLRDAHAILSILQKPISQASTAAGHIENGTIKLDSSSKVSEVPGALILDLSEDDQQQKASSADQRLSGNVDLRESNEKVNSSEFGDTRFADTDNKLNNDADTRNSSQLYLDNVEAENTRCLRNLAPTIPRSGHDASHCPVDDESKSSWGILNARETDELPSFDLGF